MSVQSDEDDEYLATVEGQRARALATIERVKALIPKWVSDRATYPLDDIRTPMAFLAVKACGEELTEAFAVEPASNPPSSPMETTEPLAGTSSYTGVIRPADEAEARFLGNCPACVSPMYGPCGTCISKANAAGTTYEVQRLWDVIEANGATNSRLMRERDEARAEIVKKADEIGSIWALASAKQAMLIDAESEIASLTRSVNAVRAINHSRDATIERLWAQLNEETNVPHAPTEPAPELEVTPRAPSPFTGTAASRARAWLAHQDQLNRTDDRRAT